ncbi:amidohydrolase [Luteimonas terricola]|uniref:N-acyl-L-amino acid amidohydrolase n=1 Tax=Luteimonas terricola TaxID=645597 RepID=A0ABQ2EB55_9GAMM|nr:amidohydrolase [Luteimonas terricola]GGK03779.1 N-acyl-L-amino acid amidohydrolase [Luteimonas terricola]
MTFRTSIVLPSLLAAALLASMDASAQASAAPLEQQIREESAAIFPSLVKWRRDIHQHPELGEQETRTAKLVADHLKRLGLEVDTGIGKTGVVGVLRGGKPGRTVALRADMDALPVKEPAGLPFASQARGIYHGAEVDVMHACGHDAHTAMLMAAAEVLAGMKDELEGTVMFVFQPAEEGSSLVQPGQGASWGAKAMLEDGVFDTLKPDAVFALHVMPGPSGQLSWRSGATTAASDMLHITVSGSQGHGGMPWNTVDPVVTSAQVIGGVQTVVSRKANLARSPTVVTIGTINGGTGPNIVPETVAMSGTIRTYDEGVREQVRDDLRLSAMKIAESAGAVADVSIEPMYASIFNDAGLAERMAPVLERAADGEVATAELPGAAEDFSYFSQQAPGLYVFLGVTPDGQDPATAAPNHNPEFFVDEAALEVGTRALAMMTVSFLAGEG